MDEGKKFGVRFTIALMLAIAAGVLNYVYISGSKNRSGNQYAEVLCYNRALSTKDSPLKSDYFNVVKVAFPESSDGPSNFYTTFRTSADRALLEGAVLTRDVNQGELVRYSDSDPAMAAPSEVRVFGKFKVVAATGDALTIIPEYEKDQPDVLSEDTCRLIEIFNGDASLRTSKAFRIQGYKEYVTEPGAVENPNESQETITVPLRVPFPQNYVGKYVGILVSKAALSDKELKKWQEKK